MTLEVAVEKDVQEPVFELVAIPLSVGDPLMCVSCQSGVMALLGSRGLLVVRDVEDDVVLLECTVKNPYKVFVHPYGAYVVVTSSDGDVHFFSTYNRRASASVALQETPTGVLEVLVGGGRWSSWGGTAAVGESVLWLNARGGGVHSSEGESASSASGRAVSSWTEDVRFLVGSKSGGVVYELSVVISASSARVSVSETVRLPAPARTLPIAAMEAEVMGHHVVVFVATAQCLYRVEAEGGSVTEALGRVQSGELSFSVREASADGSGGVGRGDVVLFRSGLDAPAQSYAWAAASGVLHGLFRRRVDVACSAEGAALVCPESAALCTHEELLPVGSAGLLRGAGSAGGAKGAEENRVPSGMPEGGAFPEECPLSVALTAFHMILLYRHRCVVLNHPAGLTWAAAGRREEVCRRVRFDPFRGTPPPAPLLGLCRDTAERRLFLYSAHHLWELHVAQEHRQQWRLFIEQATCPTVGRALRARYYDAAYHLACWDASVRDGIQFLRGQFYLSAGALEHATTLLASCNWFGRAYALLSALPHEEVVSTFLEKRYRHLIQYRESATAMQVQLACLIVLILVQKLAAITHSSSEADAHPRTAASDALNHFMDSAVRENAGLFAEDAFSESLLRLLEEQGRCANALHLAQLLGRFRYVVSYHVSQRSFEAATDVLKRFCCVRPEAAELWYEFSPVLLLHTPIALVSAILEGFAADMAAGRVPALQWDRFLPSLLLYEVRMNEVATNTEHQVVRLLEHSITEYDCTSSALHNYLASLLAETADDDRMHGFLRRSVFYDTPYVLRCCLAHRRYHACVYLYTRLHLHEEAVQAALAHAAPGPSGVRAGLALAVSTLQGIVDHVDGEALRRMWLRVARFAMARTNAQAALGAVEDSKGILHLEDVLGSIPDDKVVQDFKEVTCRRLDEYTHAIAELQRRQEEAYHTSARVKHELGQLRHRHGYVTAHQRCPLCRSPLLEEGRPYLVHSNCRHVVHEDCAVRRLEGMGGVDAFLTDEGMPAYMLEGIRTTESIVRMDCIICGDALVVEVDIPLCDEDPSWRLD